MPLLNNLKNVHNTLKKIQLKNHKRHYDFSFKLTLLMICVLAIMKKAT